MRPQRRTVPQEGRWTVTAGLTTGGPLPGGPDVRRERRPRIVRLGRLRLGLGRGLERLPRRQTGDARPHQLPVAGRGLANDPGGLSLGSVAVELLAALVRLGARHETSVRRQPRASNDRPVIAEGCSCPSSSRTVGATSARTPPSRSSRTSAVAISGTGLSECAVFGLPSGSSMLSALPWSAVTIAAPPVAWIASTTSPRHASTASTAVTAARIE